MKKSEVSFIDDLKDLTSPSNFVIGIIVPLALTIVASKGNIIVSVLIIFGVMFALMLVYFFFRWLFFYRNQPKTEEIGTKDEYSDFREMMKKYTELSDKEKAKFKLTLKEDVIILKAVKK